MSGEMAIFTEALALGLIEKGFELVAKTQKAWYFTDSAPLRVAIDELLEIIEDSNK